MVAANQTPSSPSSPSNWPLLYNPLRMSAEDAERFFVARRDLYDRMLRGILSHETDSIPQHQLVIGQRGMGKTTLMNRLAVELRKQPNAERFLPLSFWEEQHLEIDRLSDFWMACLDSLANACDAGGLPQMASELDNRMLQLTKLSPEAERADQAKATFVDFVARTGKRPVLFIDNFNLLLARLKAEDHVLRAFFTKPGAPLIIAAGVQAPESMGDYSAAFYDAFRSHSLHRLSLEEMEAMLQQLALLDGRPELRDSLRSHHPRLAALRDLTGGNPRITMLIYRLCARGFAADAYADLENLLDEITPLYQSRFDQLSEQGQKLVVRLARHWKPANAKLIFEELTGFPRGTIGPLVRQLETEGVVETVELFDSVKKQISKKTGYQLAERFFNIWLLMRMSARREKAGLVCLVRFIESFFTPEQRRDEANRLRGKLGLSQGEALYARAAAEALESDGDYHLSRSLRTHAELSLLEHTRGIQAKLEKIIDPTLIQPKVFEFVELKARLEGLVPEGCVVTPKEFAELVMTSPSMLPPKLPDRAQVASAPSLSEFQIESLVETFRHEVDDFVQICGAATVNEFRGWLRKCQLTSLDDRIEIEAILSTVELAKTAEFLGELCSSVEPQLALLAYQKAIELDPKLASPWNGLGNLLQDMLSRYEEAEAAYRKAIELDPKYAAPWNGLGNLLQNNLSRYKEAEEAYRKAIELDPKLATPWNNLGNLLQGKLSRYEEAEAAYRKAIDLEPKYAFPWFCLGYLLQNNLSRYEEAEAAYLKALELDPRLAAPWNGLGNLLKDKLSRYEEAEAAYRKAIELNPKYASPWNNLGQLLHYKLNRYEEAEVAYRKATELDPNFALPWIGLGNLLQVHLSRYEDAEAAYRKTIKLDPKNASPWNGLGKLYLDYLGKITDAEIAFRKSLELDPGEDSPRHNLAFLLRDYLLDAPAAKQLLEEIRKPNTWKDTQALHSALFAAYEENWGSVQNFLREALATLGGKGLPANTTDDWCRATAVLLHLGYGGRLVEFLKQEGADTTLMPWFVAVQAHAVEDKREIKNFPAEAQGVAEKLYDEIQYLRRQLPQKSRRNAPR